MDVQSDDVAALGEPTGPQDSLDCAHRAMRTWNLTEAGLPALPRRYASQIAANREFSARAKQAWALWTRIYASERAPLTPAVWDEVFDLAGSSTRIEEFLAEHKQRPLRLRPPKRFDAQAFNELLREFTELLESPHAGSGQRNPEER